MARERRHVEIYCPAGFKPTWKKFKAMVNRDGQSASELVRIWIERYVAVKDPGNPQRPLTMYDPTHVDYYENGQLNIKNLLLAKAKEDNMSLAWKHVIWEFRDLVIMKTRIKRAEEMSLLLHKEGVKIIR